MTTSPKFAAFIQGQIPEIAAFDKASTALSLDLDAFVNALRKFCNGPFCACTPARLARTNGFMERARGVLAFCDFADAPNALAYHDLTPVGLPLSKMFVKTMMSAHRTINSWGGA